MEKNIFQDYQEKKTQITTLASEALNAGWLNQDTYDSILKKINEDILTIGVIGQMKCGKSTFLNSFLFGEQLLPAATTPMTAALSVITYGEQKEVIAEFYTPDEWEELKTLASRNEDEASDSQIKSSIKAAKELYEKAGPIMSRLPDLLGKTRHDDFNNLIEYVGADGKYVSIVKSVRITLPEEWLKGVEIVDTPGFNDPVISREERTKEFLKNADVVLMMLYAGRAFDATDRDILFDKIRRVGVGKVILAVNKYDIQLAQGETPDQIKENVINEVRKAMRLYKDESLNELLEDIDPVLVSAQMALLAKMPITDINENSTLSYHYRKICDDFEVVSQQEILKLSQIRELENKVRDIIVNQKEKILIQKPKNLIFAKIQNKIDEITKDLFLLNKKKEELSIPDDELEERVANLEKAQRRIEHKIKHAESDLADEFDTVSISLFRRMQDIAYMVKAECRRIIDGNKRDNLNRKLKDRLEIFETREFPSQLEDTNKQLKKAFDDNLQQLSDDIGSILKKYVDEPDEISKEFMRIMKQGIDVGVDSWRKTEKTTDSNEELTFGDIVATAGGLLLFPIVLPCINIYNYFEGGREDAHNEIDNYFSRIDWDAIKENMEIGKQRFIKTLGGDAANEFISRLLEQAEEAKGSKEDKEKKLEKTINEINENEKKFSKLKEDLSRLKTII